MRLHAPGRSQNLDATRSIWARSASFLYISRSTECSAITWSNGLCVQHRGWGTQIKYCKHLAAVIRKMHNKGVLFCHWMCYTCITFSRKKVNFLLRRPETWSGLKNCSILNWNGEPTKSLFRVCFAVRVKSLFWVCFRKSVVMLPDFHLSGPSWVHSWSHKNGPQQRWTVPRAFPWYTQVWIQGDQLEGA